MSDSKTYTLGLHSVELGDIAQDGGMGQTLASVGYTKEGTAVFSQATNEITKFYAEEVDDPVMTSMKAGEITFSWSIINPSVSVLELLMGGTATAETDTWEAPSGAVNIEKSAKITAKQGFYFEVPRLQISAVWNAPLSKTDIVSIDCVGTILVPTKANTAKFKVVRITPTTPTVETTEESEG